jgi:hypothetical protein
VRGFLQAAGLKPAVFICNEAFTGKKLFTPGISAVFL